MHKLSYLKEERVSVMQAIGLFCTLFFSLLGITVLLLLLMGWQYRSKHPAKVKIVILPGQSEKLEYTLRTLHHLQDRGFLDIQGIEHRGI